MLNEHNSNMFDYNVIKDIELGKTDFDTAKEHLEWWYDLDNHSDLLKTINEFKDGFWFETDEPFELIDSNDNFLENNKIISYEITHDGDDEYDEEDVNISVYRFTAFDNSECLILLHIGTENDNCILVTKSDDFSNYILSTQN